MEKVVPQGAKRMPLGVEAFPGNRLKSTAWPHAGPRWCPVVPRWCPGCHNGARWSQNGAKMEPHTVLVSETYQCELLGTVAVLGAHATKIDMFATQEGTESPKRVANNPKMDSSGRITVPFQKFLPSTRSRMNHDKWSALFLTSPLHPLES
jgi:hypothetical protein